MRDKAKDPEQNLVRQGLNWAHLEKDNERNKNFYRALLEKDKIRSIFFIRKTFVRKNLYRTH